VADFLRIDRQAVNTAHVARAEWQHKDGGAVAAILLFLTDGHTILVNADRPEAKAVAETLGFTDLLAAWPKLKQAAVAALTEAKRAEAARKAARTR
jgi:hypothetical protein